MSIKSEWTIRGKQQRDIESAAHMCKIVEKDKLRESYTEQSVETQSATATQRKKDFAAKINI